MKTWVSKIVQEYKFINRKHVWFKSSILHLNNFKSIAQAYIPILQGEHDGDGSPADSTNTGTKTHKPQQDEGILRATLLQIKGDHHREAARGTYLITCSRMICPHHMVWIRKVCGGKVTNNLCGKNLENLVWIRKVYDGNQVNV